MTMLTREERASLSEISPELKEVAYFIISKIKTYTDYGKFLASSPPQQPIPEDVVVMRQFSHKVEVAEVERLGPVPPSVKELWVSIPMRDGFENKAKVFQPIVPPRNGSALIVLFHGGGFAVGSPDQYTAVGRALVEMYDLVCVAPAYRFVPENPFPACALDAWDSLRYVASNAEAIFKADPAQGFVVGGASSGANLAAVVTQLAKDQNLSPALSGQFLSVPLLMWEESVPAQYRDVYLSLSQVGDPLHPPASMRAVVERYKADVTSPYFSPLNSRSGPTGLPPTYLQACGLDCILDDSLIYNDILREHDVKTRMDLYPGLPHGFWLFMPTLKSSLEAMVDTVQGIGWLLNREVDRNSIVRIFKGKFGPPAA